MRGAAEIAVVLVAAGHVEVQTLDSGHGVVGSEDRDQEFSITRFGHAIEAASYDQILRCIRHPGIDAVEQFVVAPLTAERGAHVSARQMKQHSVKLALEHLQACISRAVKRALVVAFGPRGGFSTPETMKWV